MAFAVGVFIAFSPLLGLHTVLAVLLAWGFRLNKVALFFGAFLNNPWTFAPITATSIWVGSEICCQTVEIPPISWETFTFQHMKDHLAYPFVLGSLLIGILASILAYFCMYGAIVRYRRRQGALGISPITVPDGPSA